MIVNVFSIHDSKAEAFTQPFVCAKKGQAVRIVSQQVNNKDSIYHKFPNDFCLFHLGTFDDSTGTYMNEKAPVNMGLMSEFLEKE